MLLGVLFLTAGTGLLTSRMLAQAGPTKIAGVKSPRIEQRPEGADAKPKGDAQLIQGTWTVVKAEIDGLAGPEEASEKQVWTITTDKISIKYPSSAREMRYRLDETRNPKAINMIPLPETIRGIALAMEGIYDMNGGELKICWDRTLRGERPGSFDRKPREPWAFFVLKRAPDAEAQKPKGDAELIEGTWQVLKDEYPDGTKTKWIEATIGPDFVFVFSSDEVTITHQKTSQTYSLTVLPDEKAVSLVRAAGAMDKLERGRYKLEGDRLTICMSGDHQLPADFSPRAPAQRLYHLQRVAAEGKNRGDGKRPEHDKIADDKINATEFIGRVVAASKDAKSFTFEGVARERPSESVKVEVNIGEKTAITYVGVAAGGAKPTVGYAVNVWMDDAVKGLAARVGFGGSEGGAADVTGLVVDLDNDGKGITLQSPLGGVVDGGAKPKNVTIRFNEKTVFAFSNVAEGEARIEKNQSAHVWYDDDARVSGKRIAGQGAVLRECQCNNQPPTGHQRQTALHRRKDSHNRSTCRGRRREAEESNPQDRREKFGSCIAT